MPSATEIPITSVILVLRMRLPAARGPRRLRTARRTASLGEYPTGIRSPHSRWHFLCPQNTGTGAISCGRRRCTSWRSCTRPPPGGAEALTAGRVGGGLDGPAGAVPALGQRHPGQACVVVVPDGGARRGGRARDPLQIAAAGRRRRGLGVDWIVQLVPFQRSASVTWLPAVVV